MAEKPRLREQKRKLYHILWFEKKLGKPLEFLSFLRYNTLPRFIPPKTKAKEKDYGVLFV